MQLTFNLSLTLCIIISSILNFPPMISGYQILWLSAVIIPLLSLSVMFIPNDPKIMTYMPGKMLMES
jgi:hypothetical protein